MNNVTDALGKIEEFHRKQVKEEISFLKNHLSTEEYDWLYEFFRNEIRENLDDMEFPYIAPSEDLDTEEDSYAEKKGTYNCVLEHPRGPLAKEVFVGDVPKLIDYLREGSFTRTPRNCELAKKV